MKRVPLVGSIAAAAMLVLLQGGPTPALARDFTIDGTLECGRDHGEQCATINNTVGIITTQMSGQRERIVVDVSWVRNKLRDFWQDCHIQYAVRDGLGPSLIVVSVDERHGEGTDNPGLSNGSRLVPRDTEPEKDRDEEGIPRFQE